MLQGVRRHYRCIRDGFVFALNYLQLAPLSPMVPLPLHFRIVDVEAWFALETAVLNTTTRPLAHAETPTVLFALARFTAVWRITSRAPCRRPRTLGNLPDYSIFHVHAFTYLGRSRPSRSNQGLHSANAGRHAPKNSSAETAACNSAAAETSRTTTNCFPSTSRCYEASLARKRPWLPMPCPADAHPHEPERQGSTRPHT